VKINDWLNNAKNFLVFMGRPGIGKTNLCAAMIPYVSNFQSFRYYNEGQLQTKVRNTIGTSNGDCLTYLKGFIDDDFIIIDDVGSNKLNEWREEILFNAIDYRYNEMLPTVITTNFSKEDFERNFHPRISSRLFASENTIIDGSDWPDLRQEGM
jgi:DNA replication protein DnaC